MGPNRHTIYVCSRHGCVPGPVTLTGKEHACPECCTGEELAAYTPADLADELAGALGRLSDVAEVLLANYDLRSIEDKDFEWLRAQLQFVDHASGERGAFAALDHYRKETDNET